MVTTTISILFEKEVAEGGLGISGGVKAIATSSSVLFEKEGVLPFQKKVVRVTPMPLLVPMVTNPSLCQKRNRRGCGHDHHPLLLKCRREPDLTMATLTLLLLLEKEGWWGGYGWMGPCPPPALPSSGGRSPPPLSSGKITTLLSQREGVLLVQREVVRVTLRPLVMAMPTNPPLPPRW